jgi:hypothetical protein
VTTEPAWQNRIIGEGEEDPEQLLANPMNWRVHPRSQQEALEGVLDTVGWVQRVIVNRNTGHVVDGHMRIQVAISRGEPAVPVLYVDITPEEEAVILASLDPISSMAVSDTGQLKELLAGVAIPNKALDSLLRNLVGPEQKEKIVNMPLRERFTVPPFTTLDTKQGYWQDRKREWLALGIESELGRSDSATLWPPHLERWQEEHGGSHGGIRSGPSIFDPVLCELVYRWYTPEGGAVLDPFAGGSVRGILAGALGRTYHGIELSGDQIDANRVQAKNILPEQDGIVWQEGDSAELLPALDYEADMVFTCPPYFDLEVYSDDPKDLSTMAWEDFEVVYESIIVNAMAKLRPNRFAVYVISNVRGPDGDYRDLRGLTVRSMAAAGATIWNEHVLLNAIGTMPIRVVQPFRKTRKAGRVHQEVIVFLKGDPAEAAAACGEVDKLQWQT